MLRGVRRVLCAAGFAGLAAAAAADAPVGGPSASGTDYPARPVRLVIPFAAGGGNDIIARVVATRLGETWGQPILIDNKPGAQGILAVEFVRKSAPDGYTVLVGPSGPMTGNPAIYERLPYSTLRDFMPVAMIGSFPLILVVNAALPVTSVRQLVEHARVHPQQANYGATAALFQLSAELFNQRTGSTFQHIPYKSSSDFVNAVLAGEIMIAFADPPPAAGPIRAGRLRALAVTSATRHPAFPDVPTLAEAGIPDMSYTIWSGLFMPAGTPAALVRRWHDELIRVLQTADVRERFAAMGVDPSMLGTEEFARLVAADIERWTAVAKAARIKAD